VASYGSGEIYQQIADKADNSGGGGGSLVMAEFENVIRHVGSHVVSIWPRNPDFSKEVLECFTDMF